MIRNVRNDLMLLKERIKCCKDSRYDNQFIELLDILIRQYEAEHGNAEWCGTKESEKYIAEVLARPDEPREICDDNYMTVVFDCSVVYFDKNPMHIKSEFGNVVAISRGDALAKLDATMVERV